MKRNRFRQGSGCFTCHMCKRQTRDVSGNGGCELCPQCYDACGVANEMADNGETPERLAEWQAAVDECTKLGGKPDQDMWWR